MLSLRVKLALVTLVSLVVAVTSEETLGASRPGVGSSGGPVGSRMIRTLRADRKRGRFMLSLRVKLALVTLVSLVVAAVVGGNGWSV
jgi:hypothetical protein